MATRLFARNVAAAAAVSPTAGTKSVALPTGTANTLTFTNNTLNTVKGAAQTSTTTTSLAQTTAQSGNFAPRFVSLPLDAQTIAANTWTIFWGDSEANAAANAFLALSIYVWRPSTNTRVGFIYDSTANIGVEFNTTAEAQSATISGSAVTAQRGDVLIAEFWYTATQAMATAYTVTLSYDGTNETTTGTGNTSVATYIETPQNLTILTPKSSIVFIM